jgi:hypothetical protein
MTVGFYLCAIVVWAFVVWAFVMEPSLLWARLIQVTLTYVLKVHFSFLHLDTALPNSLSFRFSVSTL